MSNYRVADAAVVLGVSDDTLRRWIEAGRIGSSRTVDGRTVIPGDQLAAFARAQVDPPVEGQDSGARGNTVSARNRLRGIVTAVKKDQVMAQVEMVCGRSRIVSLMSAEAAEDLGLAPGVLAIASVKSTSVVVELA